MPVYAGVVKELGPSRRTNLEVRRSFVDIGDDRLVNVSSSPYIDDYLAKAAANGGQTHLSVWRFPPYGTKVVAIQLPDGHRRSIDAEPGIVGAYRRQLMLVGVAVAILGSLLLGITIGNFGLLASLAVAVGYAIVGTKSLREAEEAV